MNPELIKQLKQELKKSGIKLPDIHSYAKTLGISTKRGMEPRDQPEPEEVKPAVSAPADQPGDFEQRKQQTVQRMGTLLNRSLLSSHRDQLLATLTKQTDAEQFDQAVQNLNKLLDMAQKAKTTGGAAASSFVSAVSHYVTDAKQQPAQEPAAQPSVTATAPASSAAQPMARPYRFRVGDKISSYQIVDNKWKVVDVDKSGRLQVVSDVPMYMISSLNALKTKVDAKRAKGDLTDSVRSTKTSVS